MAENWKFEYSFNQTIYYKQTINYDPFHPNFPYAFHLYGSKMYTKYLNNAIPYPLSDKILAYKIFGGQNFPHQVEISTVLADENFHRFLISSYNSQEKYGLGWNLC